MKRFYILNAWISGSQPWPHIKITGGVSEKLGVQALALEFRIHLFQNEAGTSGFFCLFKQILQVTTVQLAFTEKGLSKHELKST